MDNKILNTGLSVVSQGEEVTYGRFPSGLIDGWDGIVFYFQTSNCDNDELYNMVINSLIERLEDENEDHGVTWRKTRQDIIRWEEKNQITLVSFRVRDSY